MNNRIFVEKENVFKHMGECIKQEGQLRRKLLGMPRLGMSYYEECFVGPQPEALSSLESEPKGLSLLKLQWCLCLAGIAAV
jgi:hypothetical protein